MARRWCGWHEATRRPPSGWTSATRRGPACEGHAGTLRTFLDNCDPRPVRVPLPQRRPRTRQTPLSRATATPQVPRLPDPLGRLEGPQGFCQRNAKVCQPFGCLLWLSVRHAPCTFTDASLPQFRLLIGDAGDWHLHSGEHQISVRGVVVGDDRLAVNTYPIDGRARPLPDPRGDRADQSDPQSSNPGSPGAPGEKPMSSSTVVMRVCSWAVNSGSRVAQSLWASRIPIKVSI